MCLIRNWSPKLWIASRSSAPSPPLKPLKIFVSIKGIPASRLIARFVREAIRPTCHVRSMSRPSLGIVAKHDAGK
jgi:hypothetical protein